MRRLYIALSRSTRQLAVIGAMSELKRLNQPASTRDGSGGSARSRSDRRREPFDVELLAQIHAAVQVPGTVYTVAQKAPNHLTAIGETGVWVATGASDAKGSGAQLVPAWMFNEAWTQLRERGSLTQQDLLKGTHGQAVKRSAAVMAVLALLDGVEVVSAKPSEIRLA